MGSGTGRRRHGGGCGSASGSKRPRMVVEEERDDAGEGLCFVCKDGGELRLCDFRGCHKAYHAGCVGKGSDFLSSDEDFICEWHTCFVCKERSSYFCFCCAKHSFCKGCVIQAEFVPILRKTMGFCYNCLWMTVMIERNVDVHSNGERVDFNDRATLEFLFKDYWEIVKDKEGLTQDELEQAYAYLKGDAEARDTSEIPFVGKQDAEGTKVETAGDTPGEVVQPQGAQASDGATTTQVITIDEDEDDHLLHTRGGQTEVIDLEADDDADTHPAVQHETDYCSRGWYYTDPQRR